ncbi:acetyltransferase [Gillisia limnaea]|uniref:Transferase hexapeptide repeat containing protein n=1 Tax=Gillisia limnaea (strain DSM 15749 / LMG 21470 / R-8282) TaxID=865937 RepID=H2BT70_GILLR|nr:acetyltransferase [Gillisia limnaea]EHQ02628.1 transferase hexapeptide repeat containing protein [Gillisia limnaea DSM 15749]
MSKKKLVIFPFNGNGIEALDCISFEEYDFLGFVDDDPLKKSEKYSIYSRDILRNRKEVFVLAVPGSPASFRERKELIGSLGIKNFERYITAIHPNASVGRNVKIGDNCLIMAGVVITSNAQVKNHVCILPNTVIHHDSVVNDYTLIGSNVVVAGGTTIGEGCYIGSGTTIINGVCIGDFTLVGLGSNVLHNVGGHAKMVGNPARNLNSHNN